MGVKCSKDSKLPTKSGTNKDKEINNIDDKKTNSVKESSINIVNTNIVEVQPKVSSYLTQRKNVKMNKFSSLTNLPEETNEKLDVIKEDNSLLDDFALIDACLNKNVFMRNLNKSSR